MTDPIADLLNRLKTAYAVRKEEVRLPASRMKRQVAELLRDQGFISEVRLEEEPRPTLVLTLRYESGRPALSEVRRLSKPGQRLYVGYQEIPRVRGGLGTVILSTSKGIKSGEAARRERVGGELLAEVY